MNLRLPTDQGLDNPYAIDALERLQDVNKDLVEALEELWQWATLMTSQTWGDDENPMHPLGKARLALSKARQGEPS